MGVLIQKPFTGDNGGPPGLIFSKPTNSQYAPIIT